jgi:predicted dehydrogenase
MAVSVATLGVAVIGCGLIGRRRAATAVAEAGSRLVAVVDRERERADELAAAHGAVSHARWQEAVARADVGAVVVCTPNSLLAEIAIAALERGKHVLIEKPMGRTIDEARRIAAAAASAGRVLKVGFNHRYHPAIAAAARLVAGGELGAVLSIRARYGHGSRPGCEREWRADPAIAGGGELLDQGVHIADLLHWFAGMPDEAFCMLQTAYWPIDPLEDNAFGLFRWESGRVAQLHVSMTQWQNLFSFEVFCERGSATIEGLGGSYGTERLLVAERRPEGGAPSVREQSFGSADVSWHLEWADFMRTIAGAAEASSGAAGAEAAGHATGPAAGGDAAAGLAAMRMIDALYRSAAAHAPVAV